MSKPPQIHHHAEAEATEEPLSNRQRAGRATRPGTFMVVFADFSPDEQEAVNAILDRAQALFAAQGQPFDRESMEMDLSATHETCALDLERLAVATDFNFLHDIIGIRDNLDRRTGQLQNFWEPRHTAPVPTLSSTQD